MVSEENAGSEESVGSEESAGSEVSAGSEASAGSEERAGRTAPRATCAAIATGRRRTPASSRHRSRSAECESVHFVSKQRMNLPSKDRNNG